MNFAISKLAGLTLSFIQAYCNDSVFANEELRLETFKNWPHKSCLNVAALARAGLFYTGESVVCAFLLLQPFKSQIDLMILDLLSLFCIIPSRLLFLAAS